jgi:hypothetical protein
MHLRGDTPPHIPPQVLDSRCVTACFGQGVPNSGLWNPLRTRPLLEYSWSSALELNHRPWCMTSAWQHFLEYLETMRPQRVTTIATTTATCTIAVSMSVHGACRFVGGLGVGWMCGKGVPDVQVDRQSWSKCSAQVSSVDLVPMFFGGHNCTISQSSMSANVCSKSNQIQAAVPSHAALPLLNICIALKSAAWPRRPRRSHVLDLARPIVYNGSCWGDMPLRIPLRRLSRVFVTEDVHAVHSDSSALADWECASGWCTLA